MSDPAVEAAVRVRRGHPLCLSDHHADSCLTDAAREALKPIRELHDAFADFYRGRDDAFAAGVQHVLRDLRELVYSSEELDRG